MRRLLLLPLLLVGCPKKPADPEPALTGPPPSAPHHGAWFGSGMAFPGERLCLVFCPDGRLYAGDSKCEDVWHPKFETPWAYTLAAGEVSATKGDQTITFQWQQAGYHAVANIAGISGLPLDQQSTRSPLCGNAPMPEKPEANRPPPEIPF
jgi:hypothetical protein